MAEAGADYEKKEVPAAVSFVLFDSPPKTSEELSLLSSLDRSGYPPNVVVGGIRYPGDVIVNCGDGSTIDYGNTLDEWVDKALEKRAYGEQTLRRIWLQIYEKTENRDRISEGGTHRILPQHKIAFTSGETDDVVARNISFWKDKGYRAFPIAKHQYIPGLETHIDLSLFVGQDMNGNAFGLTTQSVIDANPDSIQQSGIPFSTVEEGEVLRGGLNVAMLGNGEQYVAIPGTGVYNTLRERVGNTRLIDAPRQFFTNNAGPACRIASVNLRT